MLRDALRFGVFMLMVCTFLSPPASGAMVETWCEQQSFDGCVGDSGEYPEGCQDDCDGWPCVCVDRTPPTCQLAEAVCTDSFWCGLLFGFQNEYHDDKVECNYEDIEH